MIKFTSRGRILHPGFAFLLNAFKGILVLAMTFTIAQAAPGALDPTFGTGGKVVTPDFRPDPSASSSASAMLIQPDGKIIVTGTTSELAGTFYRSYLILARYNTNGSLDQTFGTGGKVVTDLAGTQVEVYAIALQPDGKILVGGTSPIWFEIGVNNGFNFVIVRFNSNGSVDTSFDSDGLVVTDFSGGTTNDDQINSLAVQADGKIVAAGHARAGSTVDFAVARYNTNGSPDTSFDTDGKRTTQVSTNDDSIKSVRVQPDGKIVAIGYGVAPFNSDFDFAAVRYNTDGSLDANFGAGGMALTGFSTGEDEFALAGLLQPDGKIVAGGYARTPGGVSSNFALVRWNSDGSLDTNFGTGGRALADFFERADRALALALQPNGKIVAAGYATVPASPASHTDFAVARFTPTGLLDSSFGTNGKTTTNFGGGLETDHARAVVVQADGKIVAAGFGGTQPNTSSRLALARFIGDAPNSLSKLFDFDGDGQSDIGVFRPTDGRWYLSRSAQGFSATAFGLSNDRIVPADYDGDGKTDIAVFRNGAWYILYTLGNQVGARQFGASGDVPVPADYDGDGRADFAVYRASEGAWYRLNSSDNSFTAVSFGLAEDRPTVGDFDGDGKADIAVFRPSTASWYRLNSSDNSFTSVAFGLSNDIPVAADYDGDGKADVAVFRPTDGGWYRLNSSDNAFVSVMFGTTGDVPVAADYDGDGKTDIAVFRAGEWYALRSTAGFMGIQFGLANDVPVTSIQQP